MFGLDDLIKGGVSWLAADKAENAAKDAQSRDFQFQQNMAKENRIWTEHMYDTRYQKSVSDLKAAGLNPALAYSGLASGSPSMSSVGGSSAAQAAASAWGNVGNFASALTSATSQPQSLTELQNAQAKTQETQQSLNKSIEELNVKYGLQVDADVMLKNAQRAYQDALEKGQSQQNAIQAVKSSVYSNYPEAMKNSTTVGEVLRNILGGILSVSATTKF